METTLISWVQVLVPVALSTGVILYRLGREQQRIGSIERRVEEIYEMMAIKGIVDVEVKGIDNRINSLSTRLDRVEKRLFNGST